MTKSRCLFKCLNSDRLPLGRHMTPDIQKTKLKRCNHVTKGQKSLQETKE